jgi:hypothetical protein
MNNVIDELTQSNGLHEGPDLYSYFLAHPSELDDGVHPTAEGCASIQRLWAQAVLDLYESSASTRRGAADRRIAKPTVLWRRAGPDAMSIVAATPGLLSVFGPDGRQITTMAVPAASEATLRCPSHGMFVIEHKAEGQREVQKALLP